MIRAVLLLACTLTAVALGLAVLFEADKPWILIGVVALGVPYTVWCWRRARERLDETLRGPEPEGMPCWGGPLDGETMLDRDRPPGYVRVVKGGVPMWAYERVWEAAQR